MIETVTPVILTWNEAPNITRCLERLSWAKRIVIIDSGSTDDTAFLAAKFPNVDLISRPFDNHTAQWNFGIDQVTTKWVLSLDADYILPDHFADALAEFPPESHISAYYARFRYLSLGSPLRKTLYPPRAILFQKARCRYEPDGHTQKLFINGTSAFISPVIDHDDQKSLARWLSSQDAYANLEAEKLTQLTTAPTVQDRLRKLFVIAPVITPLYVLFIHRAILDGWPGIYYCLQRTTAEVILSMKLIQHHFSTGKMKVKP